MYELIGGVGQPIAENPTGLMMEAAFQELNLQWRYQLIEANLETMPAVIEGMKSLNFAGANFTVPTKVDVIKHLDGLTKAAELIGAVNTVYLDDGGRWIGDNTDGQGFMRALERANFAVSGKSALILGAGGAARAIATELILAGVGDLAIVNRSRERGQQLCTDLVKAGPCNVRFEHWAHDVRVPGDVDVLINATSIGLGSSQEMPAIIKESIHSSMLVCDVIPNPPDTLLLKTARAQGAATMNGLDMIVFQAAAAIKLWSGLDAPIATMRTALEKGLGLR
ncbi:shikimate dehydrogenase [Shinella sp.]|uniref:shikimate dehydrogenase n=1 Tax=Shinella sp. TaxID=1870904 RepID=UPI002583A13E|nr:shikimate dehydrogenase [Shinella sp.]MCW5706892.1 shikimate dehydrogenase [Shinella sp.]